MRSCLAALFLPALLSAQAQPDLMRFVPEDAVAVVRTVGIAGWAKGLAETNVGKLIAAPAVQAAGKKLWEAVIAQSDEDLDALVKLVAIAGTLHEHAGEIVVAATIDAAKVDRDTPPKLAVMFGIAGSGDELTGIESLIGEKLGEAGVERRIDGEPFTVHALGEFEFTAPVRRGGAAFLFLGNDLDRSIPHFLRERKEPIAGADDLRHGVFAARFDLRLLMRLKDAVLPMIEAEEGLSPELMNGAFNLLGLGALGKLTYTIAADGPVLAQDMRLDLRDGDRGAVGVLAPVRSGNPAILDLVPPAARNWTTGVLDPDQLVRLYARAFEVLGDVLPVTRPELESKVTEFVKVRLVEDLLVHLGGEYLAVEDHGQVIDEDDAPEDLAGELNNGCFVLQLRDGATLAKNVETALRARGLHAGRKSEDYAGTKLHRLTVLGMFPIEYAFLGDVLVLGFGKSEATGHNVRSVLDAVAARAKGQAKVEMRPEVVAKLRSLPPDWGAIAVGSMEEVLDGTVGNFEALQAMMVRYDVDADEAGWMAAAVEFARCMRTEVKARGMDITIAANWYAADHFVMRSRW